MEHSKKYEDIKANYLRNWVSKEQLARYVELKAITAVEMQEIMEAKEQKEKGEAI